MKDRWIHPATRLPSIKTPVLCIIKAVCACDHYTQDVMARVITTHDGDWRWHFGLADQFMDKDAVIFWQPLPAMPKKFTPAWR